MGKSSSKADEHATDRINSQDHNTIRLAIKKGLSEVRKHRSVERMMAMTDTGGENWGSQVILSFKKYTFHFTKKF